MKNIYKKKPNTIEAIRFTRQNIDEVEAFVNDPKAVIRVARCPGALMELVMPTLNGEVIAVEGNYLIKGVQGAVHPCDSITFEANYESIL